MMLDKQNTLSNAQAITVTAYSTDTIDLGAPKTTPFGFTPIHDIGRGGDVEVLAQVTTTFVGGTSLQAQLVHSDNANLSGHEVLTQTDAVPVAQLRAGYQFRLGSVPPGVSKRYLGIRYVAVGTFTAGAVTAALVMDKQTTPRV